VNRLANEETNVTEETATTENEEPQTEEVQDAAPAADDSTDSQPDLSDSLQPAEGASPDASSIEVPGGRNYETIFIVRVNESAQAATDRARAVIEQSGGAVDNVRISEQRRLAYPIAKQIDGVYVVINGRFTKEAAAELDRELKLDEAVLRHMTIRLDEA
jgi:small subunit ribosomal protein S6